MNGSGSWVSPSADVSDQALIGDRVHIWDLTQVREQASIGRDTNIGRNVYIDHGVVVGNLCKIQNGAQLFSPARLGNGVFIGPGAILTNDVYPRAVEVSGKLKKASDWKPVGVIIEDGASVGAGAIAIGGIIVGRWAVVGAGATITKDVVPHALVVGTPARQVGWVGTSGKRLVSTGDGIWLDETSHEEFVERLDQIEARQ